MTFLVNNDLYARWVLSKFEMIDRSFFETSCCMITTTEHHCMWKNKSHRCNNLINRINQSQRCEVVRRYCLSSQLDPRVFNEWLICYQLRLTTKFISNQHALRFRFNNTETNCLISIRIDFNMKFIARTFSYKKFVFPQDK